MWPKGNLPTPRPSVQSSAWRSWRSYPVIWWPRKARNVKVAGSCFNLGNAFLDMVFKHFGKENAHNGLAWTLYFLSRLSSWDSPRGLAKFQKQTLHSYVPVSLLTSAAVTSDSLSCLRFITFYSSGATLISPFLPCTHPRKGHWTGVSAPPPLPPKNVLIFMTETLQSGITCFWKNFEHLWSDKEMTHYQETGRAKWKGNRWKALSISQKGKKKIVFSLYLSKKMALVLAYILGGGAQATEKQPEVSPSKSTFDFSVSAYEQMKVP